MKLVPTILQRVFKRLLLSKQRQLLGKSSANICSIVQSINPYIIFFRDRTNQHYTITISCVTVQKMARLGNYVNMNLCQQMKVLMKYSSINFS
jgi:hypothetical protein